MIGMFFFLLLLSACSSEGHIGADARALEGDEILIGVAWPFADHGDQFEEGLDLALQEINDAGGVNGHLMRFEKMDDAAEVTKGMEIAQSLASNPSIMAVIGHRNSYVSIPVSAIYEQAGIPMITPASTSPDLIHEQSKSTFRGIPSDNLIAAELVAYAARQGYKRFVIYYGAHDYGRGLANAFEKHAVGQDIQIVDRTTFIGDALHQKQLFNKWDYLQADAVMLADNAAPSRIFVEQMRSHGTELPVLGGNALDTEDAQHLIRSDDDKVIIGSTFHGEDSRPIVQDFIESYVQVYGMPPNQYAAQGYSTVYLLKEAIERAWEANHTLTSTGIAEALRGANDIETVTGFHSFDVYGENVGDLVVLKRVQSDGYQYMNSTP